MAELIAKTPCAGLLPLKLGSVTLEEITAERITSIAPFAGQDKAASAALKSGAGMALPAPNRATGKDGARAVWFGQGQAVLIGVEVPKTLAKFAALTDQSDAWAVMRLSGGGAEDVLARLVPIDVRSASFKRGHTARTQLQHMMASITRTGANAFDIMVMRSFAASAVHDLETAMGYVAGRATLAE